MNKISSVTLHRDGSISFFSCLEQNHKNHVFSMHFQDLLAETDSDQERLKRHFAKHDWKAPRAGTATHWEG